ncbi:hypothetical protein [Brenneria roseae]|uniref:hypothetical protein n=1 Tax=Brenneria roseae TaxID=1509241 RepID=UPI001476729D|nr:hypothetical protein [Brenneria roseae]
MKKSKEIFRVDTVGAFARMGAAVDVLLKAAPNALDHKATTAEKQGRRRKRQEAA